jgi:Ser/Thr protein kinase RdoA (MazF antagonist)
MTDEAAFHALLPEALAPWGGAEGKPRLVGWRENAVFEVRLTDGRSAALRLHRPGYQTREAVEAELLWTEGLARAGFPVAEPIRTAAGALTGEAGGRITSLVRWLPGAPLGAAERKIQGTEAEQEAVMAEVGDLIGRLHVATDALGLPPDLPRQRWDQEGYLGEAPLWGRFWENPNFGPDDRKLIEEARAHARRALVRHREGGGDFGLIHADCLRENIVRTSGGLALIDFDDSGWGFRAYDLATALVHSLEEPFLPALQRGLLAGYRRHRRFDASVLTLFVALRTFASAGWIITRARPGDPRHPFYAARALRMAQRLLDGATLRD